MQKTKTSVKEKIIFALACVIASAVFLLSLHAKDIVKYGTIDTPTLKYQDITAKAVAELHDHVEKKVIKSLTSSMHDGQLMTSRNRDDADAFVDEDPGLWGRISDQFMIWGIYLTLPFSRTI